MHSTVLPLQPSEHCEDPKRFAGLRVDGNAAEVNNVSCCEAAIDHTSRNVNGQCGEILADAVAGADGKLCGFRKDTVSGFGDRNESDDPLSTKKRADPELWDNSRKQRCIDKTIRPFVLESRVCIGDQSSFAAK